MNIFQSIKEYFFPIKIEDTYIPKNLDECFLEIDKILSKANPEDAEDVKYFLDGGNVHHSFGRNIRNNWKLWQENTILHEWFKLQGIWHADDMSGIIIDSYLRRAKNQSIDLDEQIQYYKNYWKENQP